MLSFSRSQACQRQPGQEDLSLQPEVLGSLSSLLSLQSTRCKASVAPGRVLGSIGGQDGSNCLLAPLIAHPLRGPGCWSVPFSVFVTETCSEEPAGLLL